MKVTFFTRLALSLSLALSLTSCIDDDNLQTPNPTPTDAAQGMIVNASPNSGDLFFFVDNNPINNIALTYTNNSPYLNYKAGARVFTVKNATGNVLATKSVTPEVNNYFSVFAVNAFSNLELIAYKDVLVYPAPNNARVRFINLSPDAAPIDIKSTTKTYATSLSFKSTTEYVEIPVGTYTFNFVNHDTQKTIYTNPGIQFTNGGVYTVYTKGYVAPPTGSNETFASQTIINYRP